MTASAAFDLSQPGFAAQSTFRAVMDATALPGTLQPIAGVPDAVAPLSAEAAAIALALFDHDTPVWLDAGLAAVPEVASWLRFHTGAPIAATSKLAVFALVSDPMQLPPIDAFNLGTPEYPDRSTTIILQVQSLLDGPALTLAGPGIQDRKRFCVSPMSPELPGFVADNRTLFPRGVDLLFVAPRTVAALPRSIRAERG
jgi:alpha-D-ribose 1-methylphosphonate 5-triphosphate synthase subunit PhnH